MSNFSHLIEDFHTLVDESRLLRAEAAATRLLSQALRSQLQSGEWHWTRALARFYAVPS